MVRRVACVLFALGACKQPSEAPRVDASTPLVESTSPDAGPPRVERIAAGAYHACARMTGGEVRCWGSNVSGELDGGVNGAIDLALGWHFTCARSGDGTVKCFGQNGSGALGRGNRNDDGNALPVAGLSGALGLAAGWSHVCAPVSATSVRCWGYNAKGQVGDGTKENALVPVEVKGLGPGQIAEVGLGYAHTCARFIDGTVSCWGENDQGQLGDGTKKSHAQPAPVKDLAGAAAIAVGGAHTCAKMADLTVRCWGGNRLGQLGVGEGADRLVPTAVPGLENVRAIAAGEAHACAIVQDGTVRCWGDAEGLGFTSDCIRRAKFTTREGTPRFCPTPTPVPGLTDIVEISLGAQMSCARTSRGEGWCWGGAMHSQTPVRVAL